MDVAEPNVVTELVALGYEFVELVGVGLGAGEDENLIVGTEHSGGHFEEVFEGEALVLVL